ncbi:MAG: hypothetical protein SPL00_05300 [Bacilli bacterium]|nr:hypothetical protein [Bacilli bacterium]
MNKKILLLIPIALASLVSCEDTDELYKGDAYISSNFIANRYNIWDSRIKNASKEAAVELTNVRGEKGYFSGGDKSTGGIADKYKGMSQAVSWSQQNPKRLNDFKNSKGEYLKWEANAYVGDSFATDIINKGAGVWYDQSPLIDIVYGQTKKMSLVNNKFGKGYLSKLYNGQIQCDGWSSYSLVEIDKSGYGTMFPAEIEYAKYFAFSARGGSDTPAADGGRISTYSITVTFYKYKDNKYVGYPFTMKNVDLQTNYSAEYTALTGFYFEDVNFDPKGVIGMSMTYELVKDGAYVLGEDVSDNFDDNVKYHNGIMLLEVLFPDSTWN